MHPFHPQPNARVTVSMARFGETEHQGVALSVPGALAGERVTVRLLERQGKRWLCRPEELVNPAPDRVEPPCPVWQPDCACPMMITKKDHKQALLAEALGQPVLPLVTAEQGLHYRSKVVFVVRQNKLGAFRRGTHIFMDLAGCIIEETAIEEAANVIRKQLPRDNGVRYIVMRATAAAEVLVTFIGTRAPEPMRHAPQVKGVLFARNEKPGNAIWDEPPTLLEGVPDLIEDIDGLKFRVSPQSFFQVHRAQASKLRKTLLKFAHGRVWDLYSGVGVNALALAKQGLQVHGIEGFAGAVDDARANAKLNALDATFEVANLDAPDAALPNETPDTIVLNPPRKGAPLHLLERLKSNTIIYIACAPKPLGAAAKQLEKQGYRIIHAQPFDLFPHTEHVESLVVFQR